MPGKDPARGARDTGRTDRGIGERGGRGGRGKGSGREDADLAKQLDKVRGVPGSDVGGPTRNPKPGDQFGKWAQRVVSAMMIPGIPAGMLVGDVMGDKVQEDQEDVDAGRKRSRRMDDPSPQGMGRVDDIEGQGIGSFGNAAADDRGVNPNGLGKGMTGGGGGKTELDAQAEEMRKRRLAAQQTALGTPLDRLGPGVLPI